MNNLYKKVRGYTDDETDPQHCNVSLIKETMNMSLKVEKAGETMQKPIFQSIQMVTKGAAEGSA